MHLRLAQTKDYPAIVRLHRATIRNINSADYPEDIINTWAKRSSAKHFQECAHKCKRWVAVENDKVIGFCDHGFDCELWGLYIHKDFIGKGVGSKLLKKAEDSMKKQGCETISLKSTLTAKPFYQKHGYKLIKKDFHQIKDKKMAIAIMSKRTT
ncbi:GNAT family N-acetyltransferase [Candidatus Peregrinibacteria bacterium]|jgi:putative acetyltransferase|nr:GNAT family N-acetyltransferase [Candidatus Peregrinibacteria bacterium]MBT4055586.1 GNAT family N-acetyltransferase [Candidatus Peregrinibacteria bacterium]